MMQTAFLPTAIASEIPAVSAAEAGQLMQTSYNRFLSLLETLRPEEWLLQTPCTEWNVRDMVAHQAGAYATGLGYREMLRQYLTIPGPGQLPEDAINALQLRERVNKTPADLIAELRQAGPTAIKNWTDGFQLVRWITIPHKIAGMLNLNYLMWIVHSRDTWIHRLDISIATGRPFEQTPEHDGRMVALVVRDLAQNLTRKLGSRAIGLVLRGAAGGSWKIGQGEPVAILEMDALDFNLFLSGRQTYEQAMQHARQSGDLALLKQLFHNAMVLY